MDRRRFSQNRNHSWMQNHIQPPIAWWCLMVKSWFLCSPNTFDLSTHHVRFLKYPQIIISNPLPFWLHPTIDTTISTQDPSVDPYAAAANAAAAVSAASTAASQGAWHRGVAPPKQSCRWDSNDTGLGDTSGDTLRCQKPNEIDETEILKSVTWPSFYEVYVCKSENSSNRNLKYWPAKMGLNQLRCLCPCHNVCMGNDGWLFNFFWPWTSRIGLTGICPEKTPYMKWS